MATYDYWCEKCKTQTERRFVPSDDRMTQRCDKCDAILAMLPSATPGFVDGPAVPRSGK